VRRPSERPEVKLYVSVRDKLARFRSQVGAAKGARLKHRLASLGTRAEEYEGLRKYYLWSFHAAGWTMERKDRKVAKAS
jgi:hypothetical protein